MKYTPGLHILSEFSSKKSAELTSSEACRTLFDQLIRENNLQKVGEVYHDFPDGGFTAVVCLTESHLSIHTWPEFDLATFDIFLSNYQKDNTEKVKAIYQSVIQFFHGKELQKTEVIR
ncbi:S-adenosylmethionine decarboxylase family protein [Pedobacter sandarakinus]|uniref:S-adenosylmethionine decarboxylase family protein n=1 Tax=Pedobacter sandarakinus TaxID=353156 RepID=UPI002245080F|nr:S-adenosylmethionine decarboxylase [Pedobacter sandarakinus]MCX2575477.1 S-adenosylmethionine decarboxylase [Pedobacter sandarakinus]